MKCEICGKELNGNFVEYRDKDKKVKMVVCLECAGKEKEVNLKWKEKMMLKT